MAIYAMTPRLRRVDLLPMISSVFFVCVNLHDMLSLIYYLLISICSAVAIRVYKKTKKSSALITLGAVASVCAILALIYRFTFGDRAVYHVGLLVCLAAVISMCFDVLANQGRVPDTPWEALVYITFFPVMPAGPFVRYGDFIEKLDGISFSTGNFLKGIVRFLVGFIKCVAISAVLGRIYDNVMALEGSFGLAIYVLMAVICGVRIYTFFSGYSDMGRGIALMLGIDIKKDFGDPFINSTPANYVRRFFRSLSEFCKLYIVSPIMRLFRRSRFGRAVACAAAGSYYGLLVCKTPEMALILFVPFAVLSYTVMLFPKRKQASPSLYKRIPGAILTFALTSVTWMLISLGSLAEIGEILENIASNGIFYSEYRVIGELANFENIVVPTVVGALVFAISRVLDVEGAPREDDISVRTFVIRAIALTVLSLMFVISVVALLPQFPDVVWYANVFHFV